MTSEEQLINRIWTRAYLDTKESHIQLLKDYAQEKLDEKDKEIEGLIEIHHAQDEDLKKQFESLESELAKYKDQDKGSTLLSLANKEIGKLVEENARLQSEPLLRDITMLPEKDREIDELKAEVERLKKANRSRIKVKTCPHCGSHDIIMFTSDDDLCQGCNKIIQGT